jgi:hypothetical protein
VLNRAVNLRRSLGKRVGSTGTVVSFLGTARKFGNELGSRLQQKIQQNEMLYMQYMAKWAGIGPNCLRSRQICSIRTVCRSQNLVRGDPRVGSTPTAGIYFLVASENEQLLLFNPFGTTLLLECECRGSSDLQQQKSPEIPTALAASLRSG